MFDFLPFRNLQSSSSGLVPISFSFPWASLVAQRLKLLPVMWETWVRSLGLKDPLEKEMATRSSILAWRIPWTEELGGLQSWGRKESDTTEQLRFHFVAVINVTCFYSEYFLQQIQITRNI